DAQKFAVDSGVVAIVAADDLAVPHTQRSLAAVRAMRTNRADVIHFPRPRLVAVHAARQSANRTDVDAHPALIAIKMIEMIGRDFRMRPAIDYAERPYTHPFVADPDAAITENAAWSIEENHRRPLLFVHVQLLFNETALARAVAERHVLQFAFAALVANRAIQRMVSQQKFERALARLANLWRFGVHYHALGHGKRAADLQFGSLFHLHQAHAARGLQRQAVVIAERRDLDAHLLGGIDNQSSRRRLHRLAVDRQVNDVTHRFDRTLSVSRQ